MNRVRFNDAGAAVWISETVAQRFIPDFDICVSSHREDGTLLGGVLLTNHNGVSMHIHQAARSPYWLRSDIVWAFCHYAFVQCGCTSLIGPIPSGNHRSLKVALGLGFEVETLIEKCLPNDEHLMITRLWRDRCRWLDVTPRTLVANLATARE